MKDYISSLEANARRQVGNFVLMMSLALDDRPRQARKCEDCGTTI